MLRKISPLLKKKILVITSYKFQICTILPGFVVVHEKGKRGWSGQGTCVIPCGPLSPSGVIPVHRAILRHGWGGRSFASLGHSSPLYLQTQPLLLPQPLPATWETPPGPLLLSSDEGPWLVQHWPLLSSALTASARGATRDSPQPVRLWFQLRTKN